MRVAVRKRHVPVRVHMRFLAIPFEIVLVLVVRVMAVRMTVQQRFMGVGVAVRLGHVQPDAGPHQRSGRPEQRPGRVAQRQCDMLSMLNFLQLISR